MSGIDRSAVRKFFLSHYGAAPSKLRDAIAGPFDPERLQTAFVLAHSVRGDALSVGLRPIAELAQALEKSFSEAKVHCEPPGVLLEALWRDACALLERQLGQAARNEAIDHDETLIKALSSGGQDP